MAKRAEEGVNLLGRGKGEVEFAEGVSDEPADGGRVVLSVVTDRDHHAARVTWVWRFWTQAVIRMGNLQAVVQNSGRISRCSTWARMSSSAMGPV